MSRPTPKRPETPPSTPGNPMMPPKGARTPSNDHFAPLEGPQTPPDAPECTLNSRIGKTNPPRPLSLRQHAAIRYLVRGYAVGKIAAHLGVDRHTIKKWKRDARFVEAMQNLRREMTAAIISPAAKASPPPHPMDPLASYAAAHPSRSTTRDSDADDDFDDDLEENAAEEMSDEEAADTEAWIEQIIAASRTGGKIPPPPPPRGSL
jgi:DNA-binding CsgD family transcriptional regulator